MKKKKAEKRASPASENKQSAKKTAENAPDRVPESPRPALAGIGRSVGNLLDRTKAYFGSGKTAEV